MHRGSNNAKRLKDVESRMLELEDIVQKCSKALDIVPLRDLEKGLMWIPSSEAIRLLNRARDAALDYTQGRFRGERGD